MERRPLKKEDALAIFEREAVLIGSSDVIPVYRAVALLGEEAVAFASKGGEDRNEYWLGSKEKSIAYLYRAGFLKAVTHRNIVLLLQEEIVEREV